jgi:lysozyme family protein
MADHRNQIDFIKKWEGGLSNDSRDIGPASFPAPCVYNGQVGWHTNKGIIYRTFLSNAAKLGYNPSCENFLQMPDSIWLKIFKNSFWDKFLLDSYRSQSIADIIVSFAWGSGIGGAYKQLAKFLNGNYGSSLPATTSGYSLDNAGKIRELFHKITKTAIAEKRVQEKLIAHYRQFYISLNNPTYIRGWLNRLNELNEFTYASLRIVERAAKKVLIISLVGGTLAAAAIAGYFISENKNQRRRAA